MSAAAGRARDEDSLIALLSGAQLNVGDFLITERARFLLQTVFDDEIIQFPNWEPLDAHAEQLAKARLLVVAGGPGLRPQLYGGIYPLFRDPAPLIESDAKLVFLGGGAKMLLGDAFDLRRAQFQKPTRDLFSALGARVVFSTRDEISSIALRRNGYDAVMTGCPAWYRADRQGHELTAPKSIQSIVFSEAQDPAIVPQGLEVLAALRKEYPDAHIVASFHHGFAGRESQVEEAKRLGVEVRDISGDTAKMSFYDEFDVHVGYRVHAGIHFLSQRKPSVIISEDTRGRGSAEALGVPWVAAWRYANRGRFFRQVLPYDRAAMMLHARQPFVVPRTDVAEEVLSLLRRETGNGWSGYRGLSQRIDGHYQVMRDFIESL